MEKVMNSRTIEEKREHYLQEIARRTPPKNNHDEYMLNVYTRLLDEIEWFLMFGGSPRIEVPDLIHDRKHLHWPRHD
jgi:CRP-like cAMP-binding protein